MYFNDTATTEIYTLSLHGALPIYPRREPPILGLDVVVPRHGGRLPVSPGGAHDAAELRGLGCVDAYVDVAHPRRRSEEHTSELPSRQYLACRLSLEKNTLNLSPLS